MYSVRHRPRDSIANFGSKSLSLFGWWQGGRGVKVNGDKRWQREGGQKLGFLRWHTFWMAPYLTILDTQHKIQASVCVTIAIDLLSYVLKFSMIRKSQAPSAWRFWKCLKLPTLTLVKTGRSYRLWNIKKHAVLIQMLKPKKFWALAQQSTTGKNDLGPKTFEFT